jgi:hypothetical protein
MGLRVSGKRALIRITPDGGTAFDASGVSADGRGRANAFSFEIGAQVVDADGYNQDYTEPVPVGQNSVSGSLTVFFNSDTGEANTFLNAMREAQHTPASCDDPTEYTMDIMPEGECLFKEKWTLEDVVLENLELPIPHDNLLVYTTPFRAGAVTRKSISALLMGVEADGLIYRSLDVGTTWDDISLLDDPNIGVYCFEHLGNGVVLAGLMPGASPYHNLVQGTQYGAQWDAGQRIGADESAFYVYCLENLGSGVVLAGADGSDDGVANGGVYRSTDYGVTWELAQQLGLPVQTLLSLGSGVVLAGTTGTYYPETVLGAIHRSIDGGESWTLIQELGSQYGIYDLLDLGGGVVLAATGNPAGAGQLYRSADGGLTWNLLYEFTGTAYARCLRSLGSGVLLAGTQSAGRIYRSTNSGAAWTKVADADVAVFGLGALNDGTLYAVGVDDVPAGVVRVSTDGGLTWAELAQTFEGQINCILGIG